MSQRALYGIAILAIVTCAARLRAADPPGGALTWKLGGTLLAGAHRENPRRDRLGYAPWRFPRTTRFEGPLAARRWLRDGRYVPLAEQGERLFGLAAEGWIYRKEPAAAPAVFRPTAEISDVPAAEGALVVAPGPEHAAVVAWESPVSGRLDVAGEFEHLQGCCGHSSQVNWYAERGRVSVPDSHATLLHQLGLDHFRLSYRHNGRSELTDPEVTGAQVVHRVLT